MSASPTGIASSQAPMRMASGKESRGGLPAPRGGAPAGRRAPPSTGSTGVGLRPGGGGAAAMVGLGAAGRGGGAAATVGVGAAGRGGGSGGEDAGSGGGARRGGGAAADPAVRGGAGAARGADGRAAGGTFRTCPHCSHWKVSVASPSRRFLVPQFGQCRALAMSGRRGGAGRDAGADEGVERRLGSSVVDGGAGSVEGVAEVVGQSGDEERRGAVEQGDVPGRSGLAVEDLVDDLGVAGGVAAGEGAAVHGGDPELGGVDVEA